MTHARSHRITQDDFLQLYAVQYQAGTQKVEVSTVLDAAALISQGDYKNLKVLIDISPPDAPDEARQIAKENKPQPQPYGAQQPNQPFQATDRPGQNFAPGNLGSLAPTLARPSIDLSSTVTTSSTLVDAGTDIPLRAKTTTAQRPTGVTVTVPATPGTLKKGGKGPKGGTITEIVVPTDQIVAINIADLEFSEVGKTGKRQKGGGKGTVRGQLGKKKAATVYVWQKAIVYEESPNNKVARPIPVEESLRPPWFSPLYSNLFIGDNIYGPFFGTGSVVDEQIFATPFGTGATGANREKQRQLVSQVTAANGNLQQIQKILSSATPDQLSDIPSIEQSADVLAYVYGEIRRQGLDVQRFVADYTHRPVATLENIFGTQDLEYTQDGNTLTKVSGVPGFHSTAVGPFSGLVGLLDNPDAELPRLKIKGKQFAISKTLDPRPERRAAVRPTRASSAGAAALSDKEFPTQCFLRYF